MSYSFSTQAPTKQEAQADAKAKFAKVVSDMPIHEKDQQQVLNHMYGLVGLARDPQPDEHVYISMHGYISADAETKEINTVNAGCSVTIARPVATTTAHVA